jgi:hypothetical protein
MRKTIRVFYVFFLFDILGRVVGGVGDVAVYALKAVALQNGTDLAADVRNIKLPTSESGPVFRNK